MFIGKKGGLNFVCGGCVASIDDAVILPRQGLSFVCGGCVASIDDAVILPRQGLSCKSGMRGRIFEWV